MPFRLLTKFLPIDHCWQRIVDANLYGTLEQLQSHGGHSMYGCELAVSDTKCEWICSYLPQPKVKNGYTRDVNVSINSKFTKNLKSVDSAIAHICGLCFLLD